MAKLPSTDEVTAMALAKAEMNGLDVKVTKEPNEGYDVGIFRCEDVPFVYRLAWAKAADDLYTNFNITIMHVRPRSEKKFVDRDFKEKV